MALYPETSASHDPHAPGDHPDFVHGHSPGPGHPHRHADHPQSQGLPGGPEAPAGALRPGQAPDGAIQRLAHAAGAFGLRPLLLPGPAAGVGQIQGAHRHHPEPQPYEPDIILGVSIPIGVIAAYRAHLWFDQATTLFVFFGFAMPTFWLALLLIMFFGVYLDWLPISGLTSLNFRQFSFWQKGQLRRPRHPAGAGGRLRRAGRHVPVHAGQYAGSHPPGLHHHRPGQGLPERVVIFKHALRNALLPVITILGLSVPGLMAAASSSNPSSPSPAWASCSTAP